MTVVPDVRGEGPLPQLKVSEPAAMLAWLDSHHAVLMGKLHELEEWYSASRVKNRRLGRLLRASSVVLGAAAAVAPGVCGLFLHDAAAASGTVASSVLAIAAATLVVLDRYFGYTSAWIRYTSAFMALKCHREGFELMWVRERARLGAASGVLTMEVALAAHQLACDALASANAILKAETETWAKEFQGELAQVESGVRALHTDYRLSTASSGSLRVTVTGWNKLKDGRWELQVGDHAPTRYQAQSNVALTSLPAGLIKLRVAGDRSDGTKYMDETVETIQSGQVTACSFVVT